MARFSQKNASFLIENIVEYVFFLWSRLITPCTMESIRHVCIACVLSLVLVHVAFSADKILYSCTFEDLSTCSLGVDPARVTWMIGDHMTDPGGQGPPADHTWGTEEGNYVYTKSEDKVKGTSLEPKLTSANFELSTGEGVLSFYFFLWGSSGNALKVHADCSDSDDMSLIGEFNLSTGSMDTWARAEALISCNGSFKIIFQAIHNANGSFIAVDDIALSSTDRDAVVSVKTPAPKTEPEKDVKEPDVTSDLPQVPMSTMPTGGVHNRPHETITLSIILFLLALLFMIISVIVHCCIWRKRKKCSVKMRNQMSVHNSGYNCPIHTNQPPGVIISMEDFKTPTGGQSDQNAEKASMRSSESGIVANGGGILARLVAPYQRVRSKTVPNKRSFEHYESIEIESDGDEDADKEKRVLSETGDKRKKGFLGKARHFTRSNSLPTSPGNDFYESIDHGPRKQGPLAYQVTDLLPGASSTSTLVGDTQDNRSDCSIPSIHSNHLKPPMLYDNLERRSPLLIHPSRHSPSSGNYTPPSHLNLNLSGSQCNLESLYNTVSTSQCDIASLSSYETPTSHVDSPSSINPHLNPFFQSVQPGDTYDSLNRRRRTNPSPVIADGAPSTPTPPSPTSSVPSSYQTPKPKTDNLPPEYQTLDPDAISDASFERSASESSETAYECPQTKKIQHVKSESSHDYEDLD
ncbi:uncharacterized protein LOC119728108 [Patiria miniata]|uniref:MAM domain-containing protein n=1 Tax=Patiria miniata TaxID=46514 RepID=A0A913ZWT3_PATMI|nr:uncharacterized protein LOC119728108 [Patiria miniata]